MSVIPELILRLEKGEKLTSEEHDSNLTNIRQSISNLCTQLENLNIGGAQSLAQLTQAVNDLDVIVQQLDSDVQSLDSELTLVSAKADQNETDIDNLEVELATANGRIDTNVIDIAAALQAAVDAASDAATALQVATDGAALNAADIDALETRMDSAEGELSAIGITIASMLTQLSGIGDNASAIVALDSRVTDVETATALKWENYTRLASPLLVRETVDVLTPEDTTVETLNVPPEAVAVMLQAKTEIAADVALVNEAYTKLGSGASDLVMARAIVGQGVDQIASNSEETIVDVTSSFDIDVTQYVEITSPIHPKVANSKTALYIVGYFARE
jgi:predicted  nucleic acid-binding Zn-ribbon protein